MLEGELVAPPTRPGPASASWPWSAAEEPAEPTRLRPAQERLAGVAPPGRERVGRFTLLGRLGEGGMGVVDLARDPVTGRLVALKRLSERALESEQREVLRTRFLNEARLMAQLDHPNILPVHEIGAADGPEPYYVMKRVIGCSLGGVLRGLRSASPGSATEWDADRLLGIFEAVGNGVAAAHARGVLHRDLKPDNVMIGAHGQVFVADWGLACFAAPADDRARSSFSCLTPLSPGEGGLLGSLGYLSPEQAAGMPDLDARSDVFSLGLLLHEILVGRPTFRDEDPVALLRAPLEREIPDPRRAAPDRAVPADLAEVCMKALQRPRAERWTDAAELTAAVADCRAGRRRSRRAEALFVRARDRAVAAMKRRDEADRLRAEAERALDALPSWAPARDKADAWRRQDRAEAMALEAELMEVRSEQHLLDALAERPDHPGARRALAKRYRSLHERAVAAGQGRAAAAWEARLRRHDPGNHAAYLAGTAWVSLRTEPAAERIELYRYEERDRRLEPVFVRELGPAPLERVEVSAGSWLLRLHAEGRVPVDYPVHVGRLEHWDGCAPGELEPRAVPLPRRDELGPDEVYVPPGWFLLGEDGLGDRALPRRRAWLDGFVVCRALVTNRDYLAFLNALVEEGRTDEALLLAPRNRDGGVGDPGRLVGYGLGTDGRFHLVPDGEGDLWELDWPVMMVDWHAARAYCDDRAARDGLVRRLPFEAEWEKAARGVDGRRAPWGRFVDPSWACISGGRPGPDRPARVEEHPLDRSPYGVCGTAGNLREWCLDAWSEGSPVDAAGRVLRSPAEDAPGPRVRKGGCWFSLAELVHAANRTATDSRSCWHSVGFRLVRDYRPGSSAGAASAKTKRSSPSSTAPGAVGSSGPGR